METIGNMLAFLCSLLAFVVITSSNVATAQQLSPSDRELDPPFSDDVRVAKSVYPDLEKRQNADDGDDTWRMKRPGGRQVTHTMAKRPGARFVAPMGGFGGGLVKRPGGRQMYGLPNRSKRPGGRYFGYQDDMKRLGGRYRWKRAGGRYLGNAYQSFYGDRHGYRWQRR